jgi:palmitoyltransferase
LILAYFYDKGYKVQIDDEKGGSPLHWAAYLGCELAAAVLLSWDSNVNQQDHDGHTPLHLAVMAENSRIIRNLLLKGADRNILDF